jgi:hypothetical protein
MRDFAHSISADARPSRAPDPQLERLLRRVVAIGLALVLLFPLARGQIPWLGWAPLWLVGMPLAAWWALHRFRLPQWPMRRDAAGRRRNRPQARRRARMPRTAGLRAA